jgi:hypothetical protein
VHEATRVALAALILCAVTGPLAGSAWAVTWCHDYTLHRATSRKEDFNRTGIETLRTWLQKHGYKSFSFTTAAHNPQAQSKLRPGDVIVFRNGNGHSAFVSDDGLLDHFVQTAGRTGTRYAPAQVEKQPNFHRGDTLLTIVNTTTTVATAPGSTIQGGTSQPYKNCPIEVWRRVAP